MRRSAVLSLAATLALLTLAPLARAQAPAGLAPSMAPAARKPAGMHTLILVRHGWYDYKDPADERVGRRLNALGREQARLAGKRLKQMDLRFGSVVTSRYTRAMETGDIIAAALDLAVVRDSLLNECTPPTDRTDIKWDTPGEADSAQAQLEAAWARYAQPTPEQDTADVLACHGNVIRWFVTRAIGADTKRWAYQEIANGSFTVITIKADGSTRLVVYDDASHIPPAKQTWAGRGPGWETAKIAR